jgi:hypothetical protein
VERETIVASMTVPFEIEELEAGLLMLDQQDLDPTAFWDNNVAAFRRTLVIALSETTDALASNTIHVDRRAQFSAQIQSLRNCIQLADRYMSSRSSHLERPPRPPSPRKIH